jgi:hypothetical protein
LKSINFLLANSTLDAAATKILEATAHTIRTQTRTDAINVDGRVVDMDESN